MQLLSQNSFHLLHDTIKKTLNVFFAEEIIIFLNTFSCYNLDFKTVRIFACSSVRKQKVWSEAEKGSRARYALPILRKTNFFAV